MFAYAMAVGIRCGWLDENLYGPAVEKAWKALDKKIDVDGNLCEICVARASRMIFNITWIGPGSVVTSMGRLLCCGWRRN